MIFIVFILFFIFTPTFSFANNEFTVVQNIEYIVNQNGTAQVNHEINLTNNISQIFAKEYQLSIHHSNIQSINAHDRHGNILDTINTSADKTTINLKFSEPTVGKDQINLFVLNYNLINFAQKKGNTWEILFPQFENQIRDAVLNVTIKLPTNFGELSFSSQPITKSHLVDNQNIIQFSPSENKNKTLLVFGNNQLFDFKLLYFLQNKSNTTQNFDIPIPPDTNLQTITFSEFQPRPNFIHTDVDGNWLASYQLNPLQEIDIAILGQAKTHPSWKKPVVINPQSYLTENEFWPTNHPDIAILKNSLDTPKSIYDYVVNNLTYDYNQLENPRRKGALEALSNPQNSLCTEFTDLFVTLARSAQIPAREIEGFAYTNNSKIRPVNQNADILHAWPEYYDDSIQSWVQVDPTWEKTTNGIDYFHDLDLNHITFVIHGQSSTNPPPPGAYKQLSSPKSVFVDFATSPIVHDPQPPIITVINQQIHVTNPNLFSIEPIKISLKNQQWSTTSISLPPLGQQTFDLPSQDFISSILPKSSNYNFILDWNNQTQTQKIINRHHYLNLSIFLGSLIFILCLSGIILTSKFNRK